MTGNQTHGGSVAPPKRTLTLYRLSWTAAANCSLTSCKDGFMHITAMPIANLRYIEPSNARMWGHPWTPGTAAAQGSQSFRVSMIALPFHCVCSYSLVQIGNRGETFVGVAFIRSATITKKKLTGQLIVCWNPASFVRWMRSARCPWTKLESFFWSEDLDRRGEIKHHRTWLIVFFCICFCDSII